VFDALSKTQPQIASQLEDLIEKNEFPCSSLFCGEPYSGRMYAAMSVAKEMGIPQENIIIVSDRNHFFRIKSAIELLKKSRNNTAKAFLKENMGILLQQYHGALMDEQTATLKKRFGDAAEISELLDRLDNAPDNELDSIINSIEKFVTSLTDTNRTQTISVGQVRAIQDWCLTSSMDGERKLVIIEGLENALSSAVNAFLKTLEEPPLHSYFILISSNPSKMLATILSRVRKFRFEALSKEGTRYIFNSLFINPNKYESLEQFFLEGGGIDDVKLQAMAKELVQINSSNGKIDTEKEDLIPKIVNELEKCKGWDIFFSHVVKELYNGKMNGTVDSRKAMYLLEGINEMVTKGRLFNQNKRLTFDYVAYRIKEVLR